MRGPGGNLYQWWGRYDKAGHRLLTIRNKLDRETIEICECLFFKNVQLKHGTCVQLPWIVNLTALRMVKTQYREQKHFYENKLSQKYFASFQVIKLFHFRVDFFVKALNSRKANKTIQVLFSF